MFYVQFNPETGAISSTNLTDAPAPVCEHQITFPEWVNTMGKMVDLDTLELIDAPAEEPPVE